MDLGHCGEVQAEHRVASHNAFRMRVSGLAAPRRIFHRTRARLRFSACTRGACAVAVRDPVGMLARSPRRARVIAQQDATIHHPLKTFMTRSLPSITERDDDDARAARFETRQSGAPPPARGRGRARHRVCVEGLVSFTRCNAENDGQHLSAAPVDVGGFGVLARFGQADHQTAVESFVEIVELEAVSIDLSCVCPVPFLPLALCGHFHAALPGAACSARCDGTSRAGSAEPALPAGLPDYDGRFILHTVGIIVSLPSMRRSVLKPLPVRSTSNFTSLPSTLL